MNTIGLVYNNNKHRYVRVGETQFDSMSAAEKRKVMFARKMQELKERQEYARTHANGYCPHCHMLRAMNGKCMNGCED